MMARLPRPKFLTGLLAVCLSIGIIANLYTKNTPLTTVVILIGVGLLWTISHLLAPKLNAWAPKRVNRGLLGVGAVMVAAQLAVLKWLPVTVYHDPYRVLSQADQMAAGHMTWAITYFWRYPNNVPIAYLLSLWLRFTNLFGLSTNTSIHLLSLMVLDSFIALLLIMVRRLSHRNAAVVGAASFMMLTPFAYTYYLQVFYSDLPAMLSLLALFGLLSAWPHRNSISQWFMGFGFISIAMLGQLLKPNLIVLIPALLIVGGLWARRAHHPFNWHQLIPIALILVGFGLSVPAKTVIEDQSHFQANSTFQLPTTSWLLMGLNNHSHGMYSGKDVGHAIAIGNQSKVQAYDLKAIPKRAEKLGIFGLLKLWIVKLGILQRVGGINNWYNGGFRAAPTWYQANAGFFSVLLAITYQIASITLMLTLVLRLWTWRPDFSQPADILILLAVTTTLGLFAFHTLLWEVESRYGQIVLPMLWLSLAGIKPKRAVAAAPAKALAPVLLATLAITGLTGASWPTPTHAKAQVVTAQRSQLSQQYHATPQRTQPNAVLKEAITLSGKANYLSVQVHQGATVQATLSNARGKTYRMSQAGSVYRLHAKLAPGTYTITIKNTTSTPQLVDVVKTYHYQLAAHPLIINGVTHRNASFVYTCLEK